jgi:DNA-binding transcriptional MocR family regulator
MGTAFQAYYHLEGKGLIEARPKSGYYVRFSRRRMPSLPNGTKPQPVRSDINVGEMITSVFSHMTSNDIINFSLASPAIKLLPVAKLNKSVLQGLRNSPSSCLPYENIQGNIDLRKQVAKLALNWGGRVKPEDFVITSGCIEALVIALRTVAKPGDTIAIESPTYFGIYQMMEALGMKAVEIPTDPVTGIDIGFLKHAIRKFSVKACLFVTNFSNPLGSTMPDENKKELVEILTRMQVPLIEDDIYGELYFGKSRPKTCKSFDKEGWVIYCSSFSKSLAPGYRIGWALPGRFTDEFIRLKLMHTISSPSITQAALAHFLAIGRYEYHLKNLRKALHTQSLRYLQAITTYFPEDVRVSQPNGGFVLWIELNKNIDAYMLYLEAMKYNISIAPGKIFSSQGQYGNCLRIGYGRPWSDDIDHGLSILGSLIRKMQKR